MADEEADRVLKDTVRNSVKTDNPYFLNALYHGTDYYGKVGAYLSEVMNTNAYSYEVAPVFTLVEKDSFQCDYGCQFMTLFAVWSVVYANQQ